MNFEEIIDRNYKATVKRGQINALTTFEDFISKLNEEVNELDLSELPFNNESTYTEFDHKELADVILVCLAMAKHYNIDILKVMEQKVIYNENRPD